MDGFAQAQKGKMMSDLISRQAAIAEFSCCELTPDGGIDANYAIDFLKQLPSAQPDIIRCKDCKHFEYDHPYVIQGVPILGHEVCNAWGDGCKTDENGYCFLAERRTDG